jgi:hypothetical protein
MHARIQSWFPFCIHVCINGREWLRHRMDRKSSVTSAQENCVPWVEDIPRGQKRFQQQHTVSDSSC